MGQLATAKDKAALLQEVNALRQRMKVGTRAVLVLQLIALVTMAIAHYI